MTRRSRSRHAWIAGLIGSALLLTVVSAAAQCLPTTFEAKLTAEVPRADGLLGRSVALSGDFAIAGDRGWSTLPGAVEVFRRSGPNWSRVTRLEPAAPNLDDSFGWSVGISGSTVVVGASRDSYPCPGLPDCRPGAAYVFVRDGADWIELPRLVARVPSEGMRFGSAVAIDGDTIAVGSSGHSLVDSNEGSVEVFVRNAAGDWVHEQLLVASDAGAGVNENLGTSVAVDGDVVVAGAPSAHGTGAAYVFRRSSGGWEEEAILDPDDGQSGDDFGWSIAIDGDVVAVGARLADVPERSAGSAYAFERDPSTGVWQQAPVLRPSDASLHSYFGTAVAVAIDTVAVGANNLRSGAPGAAVLFRREGATWAEVASVVAPDGADGDRFGSGIALQRSVLLVGANRHDAGATDAGAAYAFVCVETVCDDDGDDDGDGLVDCDDPDCCGLPACPPVETSCCDGVDNDCDGAVDRDDADCAAVPPCTEDACPGCCANGSDDDGDGDVDCADADCCGSADCVLPGPEVGCSDGGDGDCDGLTDCDDPDCSDDAACLAEDCGNGLDDDGDGWTDCEDRDCAGLPPCLPEDCANGTDEDGDDDVDCEDADCDCALFDCPGSDCDGDGVDNGSDCAPTSGGAYRVPVEPVLRLRQVGSSAELRWTDLAPSAGPETTYEISSRTISWLWLTREARAPCEVRGLSAPVWTESQPSGLGGFHYLVRGVNACGSPPGFGWGADSLGRRRAACP